MKENLITYFALILLAINLLLGYWRGSTNQLKVTIIWLATIILTKLLYTLAIIALYSLNQNFDLSFLGMSADNQQNWETSKQSLFIYIALFLIIFMICKNIARIGTVMPKLVFNRLIGMLLACLMLPIQFSVIFSILPLMPDLQNTLPKMIGYQLLSDLAGLINDLLNYASEQLINLIKK